MDEAFGNAVDAAYGRHNPYLVAHTHIAVLSNISFEGALIVFDVSNVALGINRLVGVLQGAAEVCLEVVLVDPVAGFQVLTGMTNGVAVLDDVLTLFGILDEYFVTCWRVLIDSDLLAVDVDDVALLLGRQTYDHRVGGINF